MNKICKPCDERREEKIMVAADIYLMPMIRKKFEKIDRITDRINKRRKKLEELKTLRATLKVKRRKLWDAEVKGEVLEVLKVRAVGKAKERGNR